MPLQQAQPVQQSSEDLQPDARSGRQQKPLFLASQGGAGGQQSPLPGGPGQTEPSGMQLQGGGLPLGHRHRPFWQVVPLGHTVPQLPQLLLSVWVLVQVPLQQVSPPVQPQVPLVQQPPPEHLPAALQVLSVSQHNPACRQVTHLPPWSVWQEEQVHFPLTQVDPSLQVPPLAMQPAGSQHSLALQQPRSPPVPVGQQCGESAGQQLSHSRDPPVPVGQQTGRSAGQQCVKSQNVDDAGP